LLGEVGGASTFMAAGGGSEGISIFVVLLAGFDGVSILTEVEGSFAPGNLPS
jgi:hypothetical protein